MKCVFLTLALFSTWIALVILPWGVVAPVGPWAMGVFAVLDFVWSVFSFLALGCIWLFGIAEIAETTDPN